MSKELPYFKFSCDEWLTGDITLEEDSVQGVFIRLCAYYWKQNCSIAIAKLKKRCGNEKMWECLIKNKIIKFKKNNTLVRISFLDEQWEERQKTHKAKSEAGKKGGNARWHSHSSAIIVPIAKHGNIDVDKDVDKDIDKDIDKDKKEMYKEKKVADKPLWKTDFEEYLKLVNSAYDEIVNDKEEIKKQEKYYKGIDVKLSLEKSINNFWGTESGWQNKKSKRSKTINMKTTLINNLEKNRVWKDKENLKSDKINQKREEFLENG